jgi:mono/diheme cytochrome c family protein
MLNALEIRAAKTAFIASVLILITTFVAGGIYWQHNGRLAKSKPPPEPGALVGKGRSFFLQSCAHCHGQDADGGEDAPSLLKLQISAAHMTLVIQSGIKGDMPSFAKKYNAADIENIVAYLETLK